MAKKIAMVNCDSCSGSGWISDGKEHPQEGPQYRRCDDCGGKGEVRRSKKPKAGEAKR